MRPRSLCLLFLLCVAPVVVAAPPARAAGQLFRRPKQHEGDVLRIFDKASVYVVTNDDIALADDLLDGSRPKERRVLSVDEFLKLPPGTRWYVSTVFLINRERLPAWQRVPDTCSAENDELWTEVVRSGRSWGVAHDITLSAPDGAWLRRAVADFRRLKELPRGPQKRNVRSVAVVPLSASATPAAAAYVAPRPSDKIVAHLVSAERYGPTDPRLAVMDEVLLCDRSSSGSGGTIPLALPPPARPNDTVAWRERKENGRARVVFSAPTADLLAAAVRKFPDPLSVPETPTVLASARDLRSVRRVAVAGVKNGAGGKDLARRLASRAASDVRSLDAFEVLERAGLAEVLGEVALDQAGITKAGDRARVRQLAAADALLIVEVTNVSGRTEYSAAHQRVTPRLSAPPPKPPEPSRLRHSFAIPGKENDVLARTVVDGLLGRVVGRKSDREYKAALNVYNNEILPAWQRRVDEHHTRARSRPVTWREDVSAKSVVSVSGSLRLVDLVDGLVLWEAPFSGGDSDTYALDSRTAVSHGDDSSPDLAACPAAKNEVPSALTTRAAEAALARGVEALRGTALLPSALAPPLVVAVAASATVAPLPGRVLDVDGDTILIGLGATDGVCLGDRLRISLGEGVAPAIVVVVTRVRPRTCDAAFDKDVASQVRARLAAGQAVTK